MRRGAVEDDESNYLGNQEIITFFALLRLCLAAAAVFSEADVALFVPNLPPVSQTVTHGGKVA